MSIPNYHWYVNVNDGLLRSGGPLHISVEPKSYDLANGTARAMAEGADEFEVMIEPDSRSDSELVLPGSGYYASDGTRGNLVVHLRAAAPRTRGGMRAEDSSINVRQSNVRQELAKASGQGLVKRFNTFADSSVGRVLGVTMGASSILSGVAAISDGGLALVVSGVSMLVVGALIVLGATDKSG